MSKALDFLEVELSRLNAHAVTVSTNVQTRLDGKPYANQARPKDTGVAVYFTLNKKRTVLACDKWNRPECNLWAIAKHIEALRGQARWGVGSIEQAFAGYTALPAKSQAGLWELLGLDPQNATEQSVIDAWRERAKDAHPDMPGGSHERMSELNAAKDNALATIRNRRAVL